MKNTNYLKALKAIETKRAELIHLDREYDYANKVHELWKMRHENGERYETIKADIEKMENERKTEQDYNNLVTYEIKILENNARIALINDVLPVVIDVLKVYAGKKHGDKTRDKIRQELKTATGCAVHINNKELTIVPLNENGFSYGYSADVSTANYDTYIIDNENTINALDISDFKHYYGDTVRNTRKRANDILKAYENAKKANKNYKNAINTFNKLIPDNTPCLDYVSDVKYIYYTFNL